VAASYRYARPLLAAGVTKDDIVVLLGQDDFWGVSPLCEVLKQDFGCMVICVSYLDAKRRMEVISQLKATVLVGTPSQAQNLADAAGIFGMDAAQTSVRIVITGGEPGVGSSPEIGKSIEEAWNAKSYEFYGCQDVGILAWSCDAKEGLHLMEDDYVFEILDPVTKQPVSPGADGELVVTPLLNKTVSVTRYRTRDIVSVVGEPCSCHRMMTRIVIKHKLADEPVPVEPEPPQEEVIEPEPEPVAVAAGISEVEAEAASEDIGSEVDGGHEEPAPEEPAEPETPVEPETPAEPEEPAAPAEPEKPAEE
jgi:phenylacetate-coenzyme A ligase PaaK-like adenylate-forming protein